MTTNNSSVRMDLLSWVFASPPDDPDRPILIDAISPNRCLSYAQLLGYIRRLIAGLKASGIGVGDCVCVSAFNDILYTVLYLGVIGAGGIFLGLNPSYTAHEIQHQFDICEPKLMIVEEPVLGKMREVAKKCDVNEQDIFVFDGDTEAANAASDANVNLRSWRNLLEHGESDWHRPEDPATAICHYASTSGTTGLPKAATIPHSYHVTQSVLRLSPADQPYKPVRLTALPPFHTFATPIITASIRESVATYVMRRYSPEAFIETIEKFDVSETYMPPPVLVGLPQSELCTSERMKSLRQIWVAGAAVKYNSQLPLYAKLESSARINVCWGLTECGWVATGRWEDRIEDDAIGAPLDGFEIKVDESDVDLGDGVGELLIRSANMARGYLGRPLGDLYDGDGFIHSGDIGTVRDGFVYIMDRAKDLMKVRAWQVSPAEVEAVLMQHHLVKDVAVVGVPDGEDEAPLAVVVPKNGYKPSIDDLRTQAKELLAVYKLPIRVVLVDSIPRNPTGKILRRQLRDMVGGM